MVAPFTWMKILVIRSVEKVQTFGHILNCMGMDQIHDNCKSLPVCFTDEIFQVDGSKEA